MPPNATDYSYESSIGYDSSESEDELPPAGSEAHPFEFDRIRDRLACILELDHDMGQMEAWEDEDGMTCFVIEMRSNISGMRKIIFSSGDITYRRRYHSSDGRIVDMFWDGTDGVCETCQHSSGLKHPVWYKESNRMYPDIDYSEDHLLADLPYSFNRNSVLYDIKKMKPLRVLMRENDLPLILREALKRHELHEDMMSDLNRSCITSLASTLSDNCMSMPSSVKYMGLKEQIMRDIYTKCICGQNKRKARLWTCARKYGPPMHELTSVSMLSEDIVRERLGGTDAPLESKECLVQTPCACLCACGHRNTNYVRN